MLDKKGEQMFKKLFLTVLVLGLMVGVAFAGGVTDNNNGNAGYLFVSTGENNGANSVGTWKDPSELGLKGEKGDTGEQGPAGRDGIDGLNGADGQDGQNGLDGRDGVDGAVGPQGEQGPAGQDGLNGQDGSIGPQGEAGKEGQAGTDGKAGDKGDTGSKGDTGEKGQQGIQGPQGKGLEDRVELIGEIRVLDTKRTTWSVYAGRDVNNGVGIYGAKVTVKLGRSYEERRLDELEAKLNMAQPTVQENVTVVPTATGFKVQVN